MSAEEYRWRAAGHRRELRRRRAPYAQACAPGPLHGDREVALVAIVDAVHRRGHNQNEASSRTTSAASWISVRKHAAVEASFSWTL